MKKQEKEIRQRNSALQKISVRQDTSARRESPAERAGWWVRDVAAVLGLCFRLLVSRRWIRVFLAGIMLLYGLLLSGLAEAAGDKSRIGLAVVTEQEDSQTKELLGFLREQPVLAVREEREKKAALRLLERGDVRAVLVIREGYEEWLQNGRGIPVTLVCLEGEESMRILSDLAAGGILEQYCLYQSYAAYQRQKGLPPVSWEEYQKTAGNYRESEDSGSWIEIRKETADSSVVPQKNGQGTEALYLQVVLGMLAGILIVLSLLLYAGGGEDGTPEWSGCGSIGRTAAAAGNLLYVFLTVSAAGSLLLLILLWRSILFQSTELYDTGRSLAEVLPRAGIDLLLFAARISLLFLLLRKWTGSRERFLAVGMCAALLLTGMALVRVAAVFLPDSLAWLVRWSPGGWFTDRIILVLYG